MCSSQAAQNAGLVVRARDGGSQAILCERCSHKLGAKTVLVMCVAGRPVLIKGRGKRRATPRDDFLAGGLGGGEDTPEPTHGQAVLESPQLPNSRVGSTAVVCSPTGGGFAEDPPHLRPYTAAHPVGPPTSGFSP